MKRSVQPIICWLEESFSVRFHIKNHISASSLSTPQQLLFHIYFLQTHYDSAASFERRRMEGFRLIHQAGLLLLSASFRRNILHSVDCTFTEKTFFVVHEMSRYTWSKNKKQRQCQPCRRSFFALLKLLHGYTLLFYDLYIFVSLKPS